MTAVCQACQCEVDDTAATCPQCDAPRPWQCAICKGGNAPQQRFCGACGIPRRGPGAAAAAPGGGGGRGQSQRRQVSVMFADLVGSTALSARLDPEDFSDTLDAWRGVVSELILAHGGYIVSFRGDGVLLVFGFPAARETDAEACVRCGLDLVAATAGLASPAGPPGTLGLRVGVATGLVVIGDLIGDGVAAVRNLAGETPNLAALLQTAAAPGTLVIDQATHRLLGNLFEYRALGQRQVKGSAETIVCWQVTAESQSGSRFAALRQTAAPLIGRTAELRLLEQAWARACGGEGGVVLLSGEAGIGKSRLAATIEASVQPPHWIIRWQCSPHHADVPLYPCIRQIEQRAGLRPADDADRKREKLARLVEQVPGSQAADLPTMLRLFGLHAAGDATPPRQVKLATFDMLRRMAIGRSRGVAMLLIIEDLHWADATTQELLEGFILAEDRPPILTIVTSRPGGLPDWAGAPGVTLCELRGLAPHEASLLVEEVADAANLSAATIARIVARSDGIPLFLEEIAANLRDAGPAAAVPASLQSLFTQKLDALGKAKQVAQAAAVIGREFTLDALRAMLAIDAVALTNGVQALIQSGLAVRAPQSGKDALTFRHALMQDAAYATLLRKDRQALHLRLAESLASESARAEATHPEVIAGHFAASGNAERAIEFYLLASRLATGRSALTEATRHLNKAAEALGGAPAGPRKRRLELLVQMASARAHHDRLGSGSSEARAAFERAHALAREHGTLDDVLQALDGLMNHHFSNSELARVIEHAEAAERLAASTGSSAAALIARRSRGYAYLLLGRFGDALGDLEEAMRHYGQGPAVTLRDPKVSILAALAICQTVLGRADAGHAAAAEALQHAHGLARPSTIILGLRRVAVQKLIAQDFDELRGVTAQLIEVSTRYETFAGRREGEAMHAIAQLQRDFDPILAGDLLRTLEDLRAGRHWSMLPIMLTAGAEVFHAAGDAAGALWQLDLAEELAQPMPTHWSMPELLRLRAAMCPEDAEAMRQLERAIAMARQQGAVLWEARARADLERRARAGAALAG